MVDLGSQSSSNSLTTTEEEALLEKDYALCSTALEIQKTCNRRKIRLRRILPHLVRKDPVEVVLQYFNQVLKLKIRHRDIRKAIRVKPWFKDGQDILVTFHSESVRNRVYNARTLFNGGLFFVCDELFEERVAIWKILMNRYGETNVITNDGAVCLRRGGNEYKYISISSLKEFITTTNAVVNMENGVSGNTHRQ